jgi:hypothetical protein
VRYDQAAAEYLLKTHFDDQGREIRGCQPRDIVEAIAAAARYQSNERALTRETIDDACSNYFV